MSSRLTPWCCCCNLLWFNVRIVQSLLWFAWGTHSLVLFASSHGARCAQYVPAYPYLPGRCVFYFVSFGALCFVGLPFNRACCIQCLLYSARGSHNARFSRPMLWRSWYSWFSFIPFTSWDLFSFSRISGFRFASFAIALHAVFSISYARHGVQSSCVPASWVTTLITRLVVLLNPLSLMELYVFLSIHHRISRLLSVVLFASLGSHTHWPSFGLTVMQ